MRILDIRFLNLNSLVGEWQIDLTAPAYTADGIFAITGPTGAGKTTILDAVCLALYGRTPRLNKVTQGGNEIMSRHTGACFAEVSFATNSGRYRCTWSQRRAHKRPSGDLQAPKRELANADTGEILDSSITGVANLVESITGMDFDRFTRSMLLAQGDFAAFLQAAADDRAPILEQITGTEIYSRISMRVHERHRAEREKLAFLQAQTSGIVTLEPAEEEAITQTLKDQQQQEMDRIASRAATTRAISWRTAIDDLNRELVALAAEAHTLQREVETFQPDRDRLDRALRAATLDGVFATLATLRKQQAEDRHALQAAETALPALEEGARQQAESLQAAEQRTAKAREALQHAAPVLQAVRALDQHLAAQEKVIRQGEEACRNQADAIAAEQQNRRKKEEERVDAKKTLDSVEGYLHKHGQDAWLVGGLAGVEEQLAGLLGTQRDLTRRQTEHNQQQTALAQATRTLDTCGKQNAARKQALAEATAKLQQAREELDRVLAGRLLREYRTEQETLLREMAFLARIAELTEHRAKLADGAPCPLCGATEHPFAAGNVPEPDAVEQTITALGERIRRAEDQEAVIKTLEKAETLARNQLIDGENNETAAAHVRQSAEQALAAVQASLEALRAESGARRQAVLERLLPLGITDLPATGIPALLAELKKRLQAWQARVQRKAEIEKQLADIDSEGKRLDAVLQTLGSALQEKRAHLATASRERAERSAERQALYGDRHPDTEEERLRTAVTEAENAEKQARAEHTARQQHWRTAQAQVALRHKSIDRREPELQRVAAAFSAALAPAGFADEAAFLAARLAPEQREALAARARTLDARRTDLEARRKDRHTRLAEELAKAVTNQSLDELNVQLQADEAALQELRESIAGFKHKLDANAAARKLIREKRAAILAQTRECARWGGLHELIGSADGKRFRNFAQGLTFELMIGHANQQLRRMSDRYLLIRDDNQPLELNVIDSYQAGVIRSTKNLSGGEGFLVSLALALGLSHMASRKVRVDSLFLDEGFGTLDDEALDTALETLAGLRREGKLIGVISHVAALKERIAARIQVEPHTGGRSLLSGPGCERL